MFERGEERVPDVVNRLHGSEIFLSFPVALLLVKLEREPTQYTERRSPEHVNELDDSELTCWPSQGPIGIDYRFCCGKRSHHQ